MIGSDWQRAFAVPGPGPYLLTHSVGCFPVAAAGALEEEYLQPWRRSGGDAWSDWLAAIDRFRGALAALLGGNPADFCPQSNLSSGLAKLLAAFPDPHPRRNVWLASEHAFPSLAFVLQRAPGYSLRLIPKDRSPADLDVWASALGAEDVCGALVTHVHSNSGLLAPVASIAAICRAQGKVSIVDVAQSAGILPLDIPGFGADAVLGSCIKWLCGGPGAGFLWIAPTLIGQLTPTDVGWFSHADPFEFDPRQFRFAEDARRFWGGTPSVAPFVIAQAGLKTLLKIGVPKIRAQNLRLLRLLAESLSPAIGFAVDEAASGGTACILCSRREVCASRLLERGVYCDWRGATLRLSFHIYNGDADVGVVADALNMAAAAGGL